MTVTTTGGPSGGLAQPMPHPEPQPQPGGGASQPNPTSQEAGVMVEADNALDAAISASAFSRQDIQVVLLFLNTLLLAAWWMEAR